MKITQYDRFLALERKDDIIAGMVRSTLAAKQIRERLAAINKRAVEAEIAKEKRERRYGKDKIRSTLVAKQLKEELRHKKEKYLKVYPDESFNWMVLAFDAQCLWDGIISEMEEGDKMVVEVVEMTKEEREILPEFEGW